MRFVKRLLELVRRRYEVRRGRVLAAGFSNGGFLAYRLACQTRLLSAVAGVATTELVRSCRPPRPLSILQIHARDDRRVPFAGGGVFHDWTLGAPQLAAAWRARNACPPGRTIRTRTEQLFTSTTTGCRQATSVTVIAPTTGGHAWPGALAPYGPGAAGIDATAIIARFFATTA